MKERKKERKKETREKCSSKCKSKLNRLDGKKPRSSVDKQRILLICSSKDQKGEKEK